jgi:uncharacterized protein (TIGR03066 family)
MRPVLAFLLVGLLTCVPACNSSSSTSDKSGENKEKQASAKPQDLIVGTWESTDEEAKRTMEFGKDGSLVIKQEGQPEMKGTYKLSGDDAVELEFTRPRGEQAKEPMSVKVSPDKLMLTDRDMKAHQFRRHRRRLKALCAYHSACQGIPRHGRSNLLGDFAAQVPPVVVVALQDADVPMARETLHGTDVSAGEVQGLCNCRVPQPMGPYLKTELSAQLAHQPI